MYSFVRSAKFCSAKCTSPDNLNITFFCDEHSKINSGRQNAVKDIILK